MNLSRFTGATSREALRQVRLALGPDALIVSNRRINGGVEILASDPTAEAVDLPAAPAALPADASTQSVVGAIEAMRGALEARLDEAMWSNRLRQAPQAARLFQNLLGLGFSTALLRAMLQRLPPGLGRGAAMRWVRDELAGHLPVLVREDDLWKPGLVLALVGPTGVGKTTTVAKLAARCVRRSGPQGLVLLTTDTYRIGAHEQLNLYGDMLRVPVHVVRNADELRRRLASVHPAQTVLIDNVGVSQRDRYVAEQAALLAGGGRKMSRLVVLNASSHGDTLDEVARTYAADGGSPLSGCLVTKVDEAPRLAPALDTAIRYRLPIHYVSDGQRVPDHLRHWSPSELVGRALMRAADGRDLYAPTDADIAALVTLAGDDGARVPASRTGRRAMRLLPGLLAGADGRRPSAETLQCAGDRLDDVPICAEAFELWRAGIDERGGADAKETSLHLLRHAAEAAAASDAAVAVLHGRAPLDLPAGVPGEMHASALFDEGMDGLGSPALQLAMAGGWQPVWGGASLTRPSADMALQHRQAWLDGNWPGGALVHLLQGMTAARARRQAEGGHAWLAACPPRMTVMWDACAVPLVALARSAAFRPVRDRARTPSGSDGGNAGSPECGLWVAHATVRLSRRVDAEAPLTAILVQRPGSGGRKNRVLYGLANAGASGVGIDTLARWLASMEEAKRAFRFMGDCWRLLQQPGSNAAPALSQALTAAQMGLAAWQAGRDDVLAPALHSLFPGRVAAASALSRLFVLKAMQDREEAMPA